MAGHKLSKRQSLALTAFVQTSAGHPSRIVDVFVSGESPVRYRQVSSGDARTRSSDISADYVRTGGREGETLTLTVKHANTRNENRNSYSILDGPDGSGLFRLRVDTSSSVTTSGVDYVRPIGSKRRLTAGIEIERVSSELSSDQEGETAPGQILPKTSLEIAGRWLEKSAYLTYQAPFLGGTMLTGLRLEGRAYHFPGEPVASLRRTHPFPSVHFERNLTNRLTLNLSYSRRVGWPEIASLDSGLRFSEPLTANVGNPSLRAELTDSFEAKLKARVGRQEVDLSGFVRHTDDVWSDLPELNGQGVLIIKPVNVGTRTVRGASLYIRGPLGGGFRYSLSANAADLTFGLERGTSAFDAVGAQYGASAFGEYRDGVDGRRGSDRLTVNLRFSGPTYGVLYRTSSFFAGDASWSHALTDRWSGVLSIGDLLGAPRIRTVSYGSTTISRNISRVSGPRVKLAFTYIFGSIQSN